MRRNSPASPFARVSSLLLLAVLLASLMPFATPRARAAGPWFVAPSGSNANDCLSLATPCLTIGGALGKAASGDTINIAAGTYIENLIINKSVSLVGAGAGATIIDGNSITAAGTVITISVFADVNISKVTVQNGRAEQGGGIYNSGT